MDCPYCKGTGVCEATFSARLRAGRQNRKMTQEELAPLLGVSRPQLANLETGRSEPSMAVFRAAVEVLAVRADWLLGNEKGTP